jgi:hypothetical protein
MLKIVAMDGVDIGADADLTGGIASSAGLLWIIAVFSPKRLAISAADNPPGYPRR